MNDCVRAYQCECESVFVFDLNNTLLFLKLQKVFWQFNKEALQSISIAMKSKVGKEYRVKENYTRWHMATPHAHGTVVICYSYAHEVTHCGVLGISHEGCNSCFTIMRFIKAC